MKHYKNTLIGLGYITISALLCFTFFFWALNSIYDSKQIEKRGHTRYAKKQYHQAYLDFSRAVEQHIQNTSTKEKISEGYRLAASAAHADKQYSQTSEMLRKSLQYNADNEQAHRITKHMLQHHQMPQTDIWKMSQQQWNKRYNKTPFLKDMIKQGHAHFAKKRYAQAFKNFSSAADAYQTDPSITHNQKSHYFRFAATAANAGRQISQTKKYATLALQYNSENLDAKKLLQEVTQ